MKRRGKGPRRKVRSVRKANASSRKKKKKREGGKGEGGKREESS